MVAAAAGIGALGAVAGSAISSSGAQSAANTQASAANAGVNEQNYEFNTLRGLLQPYIDAGTGAMPQLQGITQQEQGLPPQYQGLFQQFQGLNSQQQGLYTQGQGILGQASNAATQLGNMTGANGSGAQQSWINGLTNSPLYTAAMQLGQQSILANASATGGLRGGNTIASLGYLPQQTLANVMQQSISNQQAGLSGYLNALGGVGSQSGVLGNAGNALTNAGGMLNSDYGVLSGLGSQFTNLINQGEAAAAGVGNGALTTGSNISNLLSQAGQAQAGGTLGTTNAITGGLNNLTSSLGNYLNTGGGVPTGMSSVGSLASPYYSGGGNTYGFAMPAYLNAGGSSAMYGTSAGMF